MKSIIRKLKIVIALVFIISCVQAQEQLKNSDTLLIGVKIAPPFIIHNQTGDYSGVSVELWRSIAEDLGIINYRFIQYDCNKMNVMLEDVENNTIDISISPITVTAERIKKVDFSQPFYSGKMAIAVAIKGNNSVFDSFRNFFINFFTIRNLFIMLIVILIISIIGLSIWLIEKKDNPSEFRKGIRGIGDGIWWAGTIMASIGPATKAPRTFWGRVLGLVWMFTAIITISLLIGSIASYLTAGKINSEINSINDLKRKKIGTMMNTSSENFLKKNQIPIFLNNFSAIKDGLKAVADNKIQAFIYDEPILQYLISTEQMNDKVYLIPLKLNNDYYSFALPKNSNLSNDIDELIVQKLENITWKAILNKYNLN